MVHFLFWLSCKVGEMSLTPFWFSHLVMFLIASECLARIHALIPATLLSTDAADF